MNAVLEISASFIRYLRGKNIKTYLRIMFPLHNFTSVMKDDLNRSELPFIYLAVIYNERFPCTCVFCAIQGDMDAWKHATIDSISHQPIFSTRDSTQ